MRGGGIDKVKKIRRFFLTTIKTFRKIPDGLERLLMKIFKWNKFDENFVSAWRVNPYSQVRVKSWHLSKARASSNKKKKETFFK